MDYQRVTVATYDRSAAALAAHFKLSDDGKTPEEIEAAYGLLPNSTKARVVELGCGAGKDAAVIAPRAGWYEGVDPAGKLLEIARQTVPGASFVQADALSYEYPDNLDLVFALASMLHLPKEDFATACRKIAHALKPGGLLCLSLKEADNYHRKLQTDEFGERMFYFYHPALVRELAGPEFVQVFGIHKRIGPQQKQWFKIILQKQGGGERG